MALLLEKRPYHFQTQMRRRRFRFVQQILDILPEEGTIVDVGGTSAFWEQVENVNSERSIVLYNLKEAIVSRPTFKSMIGDACALHEFADQQFNFVFSNSVIEHVGTLDRQRQMAQEIRRVGREYYVQTPYRYFPIEPHVLMPFFQFFPRAFQVFLLLYVGSPWGWKLKNRQEAEQYLHSIRLLTKKELQELFPDASIYQEKFLGITKSLIAYYGEMNTRSF